ncbi:MAG: Ras GTPase-activating-like protein iqgap2 [Paramarteilia canceri]
MSGDEGKPVQNTSGFSVDEIIKREKAKEYLVRLEEIRRILLRKKGILAFGIESLDNKVDFKDEDIKTISNEFDKLGIVLPHFGKIDGMIANEISFDKAQVLAALIKINEAIDEQSLENLRNSLGLPAAEITNIDEDLIDAYMLFLSKIKKQKEEAAILIHGKDDLDEMDYFEKNLTQKEIQNEVISANTSFVLTEIDKSIKNGNEDDLYKYLQDKKIHLKVTLNEDHKTYYLNEMTSKRKNAAKHYEKTKTYYLDISDIESGIETATINAHRDLEIKNCLDMLKIAVIENNLDKFALAIQTKALEIDNIDTNNLHNYLDYLRKLYKEDNNIVFDKNTIQSCINAVNGDVVNKKKIENILLDIKSAVKSWDLDKLEELLKSSLLGLEVDDDNIFLYGKLIAEDLSSVDNLTNLKDLIAKAAEIKEKCKHLSLLTINVTKNTNENSMKAYLNDNVTGIEDFDENSIELYTQRVKECLDKIYWKENKESVINKAILTNYFRGEMKNGLEFFYDESSDKLSWTQDKNKIIDRSRLNRNQIQKIIAHANCFTSISLKKDDIDNLVDLFRSLLEKKLISDRYNNIIDNIDNIEKIQFFLVNLVGMNEFKRLMSGEKIPFSVLSKFIGILFPTKSDYEQSLEHFRLKSEVKEEIIKLQNKESQIKELEIQTGLLIRSAYSHREKQSNNK